MLVFLLAANEKASWMYLLTILSFYLGVHLCGASSNSDVHFRVSESVPVGTTIGYVWDNKPLGHGNKFYTIFPDEQSQADKLIAINEHTGEIKTIRPLDYEQETQLIVLCIPNDGSPSRKVLLDLLDENDNSPKFTVGSVEIEIPEYSQVGTTFSLPYADDPDSAPNNVQKYRIMAGNVNNVFRVKEKIINERTYLDLVVNGALDREYRSQYDILLEAVDGGSPSRSGNMSVHVRILDANDNAPQFEQPKYNIKIPANVSLGFPVITVKAKDADEGENARISYQLQNADYKGTIYFRIDSETGVITTTSSPLPPDTVFSIKIIAFDHGIPHSLESTAYLSVVTVDTNPSHNVVFLDWLTDDGRPILMENLSLGFVVARVSIVEVPSGAQLSLTGTEVLCLRETDAAHVYLILLCGELDREKTDEYNIHLVMTINGGKIIFEHPVHLEVGDVNDNSPEWPQAPYRFLFNRSDDAGQQASNRLIALDKDYGLNALLHYSVEGTDIFRIHPENGVLSTVGPINCSVGNHVRFRVVASDSGKPPRLTKAEVLVDIVDDDAPPPAFEKTLYEVSVREDIDVGTCVLQVTARDKSCGGREEGLIYTIQQRPLDVSHFSLDPQSGKLCVLRALDFEQQQSFQLTVLASSQNQKTAKALVYVYVQDLNDNVPIFSPLHYYVTIDRGLESNATWPLLQVRATDKDKGEFGELIYNLQDDLERSFKIDAHTGTVYYVKKLAVDAWQKKRLELKVTVSDGGGLKSNENASINILFNDFNGCPVFSQRIYEFIISEDILPGISFGVVKADDASIINIKSSDGKEPEYFHLDAFSGRLSVLQDMSEKEMYFLVIEAISSSGCTSYSQVKVVVEDVNNHTPEFDTDHIEISIPESFPIHTKFFCIQAYDKDRNENGRVTYELMSSHPPCPVIVQPLTGQIILAAPLDYETVKLYELVIRAQDQGIPALSSSINITLNVLDENDNRPEFKRNLYKAEISENAALMTTILRVEATDKDTGNNGKIKYRIINNALSDFEINPITGEVFLKRTIDRERQADYTFVVVASDMGNPSLEANASLHVKVLDINDNSPNCSTITPLEMKGDENKNVIGRIEAKDPDNGANGTVTYRIQKYNEYFDVKQSGHVTIKRRFPPNLESYSFFVIAEDHGPTPRSVVCQVRVNAAKESSQIVILDPVDPLIKLDPACGIGCQLARINVTNVERWELEDSSAAQYFKIDEGILKVDKKIDGNLFATPQSVVVNMFDKGNNQKQLTFTIKKWVRVVNHEHTNTIRVSEKLLPGTKVVSGGGSLEHCYYTLDEENGQTFGVNPTTGDVYLTSRFNYTAVPSYNIKLTRHNVLVPDILQSTLIVNVEDDNMHPPRFSHMSYNYTVMEDLPVGSLIGRLRALDGEHNNATLTYRIIGGNDYFTIDESSAEIYTKAGLDYEKNPRHHFVVEVLDNPENHRNRRNNKCVVVIEVTDTNNHTPFFVSDNSSTLILNSMTNSIPFHYFVATDGDSGDYGKVKYSIIYGNKPEYFRINSETGELAVLNRPDSSVKLTVRASDSDPIASRYADQVFSVNVKQSDLQWFFFSKSVNEVTVTSNMKKRSVLLNFGKQIKSNSLHFKLLPQTEKNFAIDELTGVVTINSDQLSQTSYSLAVYVLDKITNKSDTTSVIIKVPKPVDGPKISDSTCGEISILENHHFDILTRIVATVNGDSSKEIRYNIVGGSGGGFFTIDELTGIISSKPLDRETQDEHILVISASDQQTPKRVDVCTMRVHVLDENDNIPIFIDNSSTILLITDKQSPGAIIGKIPAVDADQGLNGQVWYKLSSDESGMLDIMPQTGEIIFARNLPFTSSGWEATVIAEDLGISKTMYSAKTFTVKWERKSIKVDQIEEVQFLRHNYTTTTIEGLPRGTFVVQLESTDTFMPISKVNYSIMSGNHDAAFTIDELGVLKTAQVLDSEIRSLYTLKLVATGNFRVLPECLVTIRVLNVNDNSPMFSPPLTQHIEEDLPVGSLVMSIRARDADPNSFLEYALSPPSDFFHLCRITGDIILLKPLDYETQPEHVLNIHAYDGEHTVFTEFSIKLIDVNDNLPKFTSDLFEFNVGEGVTQGSVVGKVSAVDVDSAEFGVVHYSIIESQSFVNLDENSGLLTLVRPLKRTETIFLTVQARDLGSPPLLSLSTIRLTGTPRTNRKPPKFKKTEFKFLVAEDFPVFLPFGLIDVASDSSVLLEFNIININGHTTPFKVLPNGKIYLTKELDYEVKKTYNMEISVKNAFEPENSRFTSISKANLFVSVADANDNSPVIAQESMNMVVALNERIEKGAVVARIIANDMDDSSNAQLSYYILAGNDPPMVIMNQTSGELIFDKWYDNRFVEGGSTTDIEETISVMVTDNGAVRRWAKTDVKIVMSFSDWSGSGPMFPVPFYKVFLPEATKKGSRLLRIRPVNKLGLYDNSWSFDIANNDEIFSINTTDGSIYLDGELDYELHNEYEFVASVRDKQKRSAEVPIYISVIGVDENAPVFTMSSYEFYVPWSLNVGGNIGRIEATDLDKGVHSKVVYTLEDKTIKSIGIDPNSGVLLLREPLARLSNHSTEEITVIASSSPLQFSKTQIILHFMDSTDLFYSIQRRVPHLNRLTVGIGVSFFSLILVLLTVMLYRFCHKRTLINNPKRHIYSVAKGNVAMMASVNRLSPNYFKTVHSANSSAPKSVSIPCSIKSYEPGDTGDTTIREKEYAPMSDEGMTRSQMDSGIDADSLSVVSGVTDYLSHVMTRTSIGFNTTTDPVVNQILNATLQEISVDKEPPLATVRPTIGLVRPQSIRKQLNFNFPDLPSFNEILRENDKQENLL